MHPEDCKLKRTPCHQRRVPEHYTANQWASLVKVMGPRTGLPKAQQALIMTFLQYHADDVPTPDRFTAE